MMYFAPEMGENGRSHLAWVGLKISALPNDDISLLYDSEKKINMHDTQN